MIDDGVQFTSKIELLRYQFKFKDTKGMFDATRLFDHLQLKQFDQNVLRHWRHA